MTEPSRKSKLVRLLSIIAIVIIVLVVGGYALLRITNPRENPPVISEPNWDSPQTRELAQRACFDCHSNETVWPWYSYIPPISQQIERDVKKGRRVLNFSDWDNVRGEGRNYHELAESIFEGGMPPRVYLKQHADARLTSDEKKDLLDGLKATLEQK